MYKREQPQQAASEPLQDPTGKYPKPPFRKQSQPWPGLAKDMDPPPDHGEEGDREAGPGEAIPDRGRAA